MIPLTLHPGRRPDASIPMGWSSMLFSSQFFLQELNFNVA
jgi:hypothetical protein